MPSPFSLFGPRKPIRLAGRQASCLACRMCRTGPGQVTNVYPDTNLTGLVWLLQGRRVVELTKDKAVIETPKGTVSYRPYNKPAPEPLGDSFDDFAMGKAANSAG